MDCHMKNDYGCNYLDEVGSAYCDVDIHFESGGVLKERFLHFRLLGPGPNLEKDSFLTYK